MIKYWRTLNLWKVVNPKNKENKSSDLEMGQYYLFKVDYLNNQLK